MYEFMCVCKYAYIYTYYTSVHIYILHKYVYCINGVFDFFCITFILKVRCVWYFETAWYVYIYINIYVNINVWYICICIYIYIYISIYIYNIYIYIYYIYIASSSSSPSLKKQIEAINATLVVKPANYLPLVKSPTSASTVKSDAWYNIKSITGK